MRPAMKRGLERDAERSIDGGLMLIHHSLPRSLRIWRLGLQQKSPFGDYSVKRTGGCYLVVLFSQPGELGFDSCLVKKEAKLSKPACPEYVAAAKSRSLQL